MQARFGDAGNNFHSLDDIYYYGGQQGIKKYGSTPVSQGLINFSVIGYCRYIEHRTFDLPLLDIVSTIKI